MCIIIIISFPLSRGWHQNDVHSVTQQRRPLSLHSAAAEDELWIAKLLPAIADELPRLLNEDSAGFASRVCQSLLPAKGEGKNTTQDATRDKTRDKTRDQNKAHAPAAQGVDYAEVDCAEKAPLNNAFAAAFDKSRSLARKG